MKLLTQNVLLMLALALPEGLLAAELNESTCIFDSSQLVVNHGTTTTIRLGTNNTIEVLTGLSLPVQSALVPLHPGESPENITFADGPVTKMGILAPHKPVWDGVTSSEDAYVSVEREHNSSAHLGMQPVIVLGETSVNNQRYGELMIFPVTVDSSGSLSLHASLTINIDGRMIAASELLSRDEIIANAKDIRDASVAATGSEYLIVTSAALAEAMQRMVKYKVETGYNTELDTIESILTTYSGRDYAEKLRERLKVFYSDGGRYVLLAGDETVLPIRYAYPNMATEMPPLDQMQVCDLYFADLTGDWDADGDGIWGEKYTDNVDLVPELLVGRLPINTPTEAANYIAKLIQYETDPGAGDRDYLERAAFFASDQMRDYDGGGQHGVIARTFPSWFGIDTTSAVERATGDDASPSNLGPSELAPIFANGFGIINVVAHGRSDGFVLKSSGYNNWPKTYILTDNNGSDHGQLDAFTPPDKPAFYYSLGCNNGGFDMDQPPMNQTNPCMVQDLIGGPSGAVGIVAYSRWGWISSSYLLQTAFFDSLFAHPERPAVEALYASKAAIYYYRDLVYGLNYFGDPSLKVYTHRPEKPEISMASDSSGFGVTVAAEGVGLANCRIILSQNGEVLSELIADADGKTKVDRILDPTGLYRLTALTDGACVAMADFIPSLITGVDDEDTDSPLPDQFALRQNYPNPFNPNTTISYDLPTTARVRLVVYNLLGQVVTVLAQGIQPAGSYSVTWDGDDRNGAPLASGVYFYRLETDRFTSIRKMIMMK